MPPAKVGVRVKFLVDAAAALLSGKNTAGCHELILDVGMMTAAQRRKLVDIRRAVAPGTQPYGATSIIVDFDKLDEEARLILDEPTEDALLDMLDHLIEVDEMAPVAATAG